MTDKTELKLYNTLTRTKEVFEPIDVDNVRMYVCGPTVYDFAHIGNARPVIVFDVLNRLLRHLYGDSHVTYVRNITDVDDKINARALRDFPNLPLNEAIRNVTEKTANQFHEDIKSLGCAEPDFEPRATEHIDGMIAMIQVLIDKGHAYVVSGSNGLEVLFDVKKMPAYGKLSNRKLDEQLAGARVAVESHKRSPGDFVLWKQSNDNEPGWDASYTDGGKTQSIRGRPGWHIECSVMSEHHLGKIFDIHGGGLDLIFPHHENEIAQSCCAHDEDRMANVWMHNGYLQVDGKKMSKSDGNFITIYDLLHTEKFHGRKWPGGVLRLAMLMTHYREPIDFSKTRLVEAEATLASWLGPVGRRGVPQDGEINEAVIAALADDLNSNGMRIAMNELVARARKANPDNEASLDKRSDRNSVAKTLVWLGLADLGDFEVASADKQEIRKTAEAALVGMKKTDVDAAVALRSEALAAKDFSEADRIRDELLVQGIQLMDSKDKETGERITTWEAKR